MATPPTTAATATLSLDKYISAARRMNPQPAKNTSLPFSSINLTRPATEQSLPATCPSLHLPPLQPPTPPCSLFWSIFENTAPPYCSRTNLVKEKENRKGKWGKKTERSMSESLHGFHWVGVSDLAEKEGKRRLKCWGAMKNDPWMEPLLTLLHAGQGMRRRACLSACEACCCRMLFPCLIEWHGMGVSVCAYVVTERQTTQTESDNKTCWLEQHIGGRLYLILYITPLCRSTDFSGRALGFYRRCCDVCSSRDITDTLHAPMDRYEFRMKLVSDCIRSSVFILTAAAAELAKGVWDDSIPL